nr:zinc finger protein OZF-like isoform X2 [Procambarus clarkii]
MSQGAASQDASQGLGFFPMVRERRQIRYECSVCGRTFSNVYNLKVHMRDQHSGLGSAKCEICGLSFKNLSTLRVHKSNYHRKPASKTNPSTSATTAQALDDPRLHA